MGSVNLKLTGGRVITMGPSVPTATAVGLKDGRVELVGSDEEVRSLDLGPCDVVELRGATVLPGFVDSHAHVFATALASHAAEPE